MLQKLMLQMNWFCNTNHRRTAAVLAKSVYVACFLPSDPEVLLGVQSETSQNPKQTAR